MTGRVGSPILPPNQYAPNPHLIQAHPILAKELPSY